MTEVEIKKHIGEVIEKELMKIFGPIPGPTTITIEEYAKYEIEFEKLYLSMKQKNDEKWSSMLIC